MHISAVRAIVAQVPLPAPIRLATMTITARRYLIVIVETDVGLRGVGYGFAHDDNMHGIINRTLRPLLIDEDPLLTEQLWERMYVSTRSSRSRSLMMRALSAVDIALWDLKGLAAGLPLYQLAGGYRQTIPALMAGGYDPLLPAEDRDAVGVWNDEARQRLTDEMNGYAASGYSMVKLTIGADDPVESLDRVRVARAAIGPHTKLAVDVNGAWQHVKPAAKLIHMMEPFDLAYIEEPFGPDSLPALKALAASIDTPIAVGEASSGREAFRDLLIGNAANILRPDATVVGGISEWLKVAALASSWDAMVLPHHFPEIHAHLVAATPYALAVEVVRSEHDIMNMGALIENPLQVAHGSVTLGNEPGLGLRWKWDDVERYTVAR